MNVTSKVRALLPLKRASHREIISKDGDLVAEVMSAVGVSEAAAMLGLSKKATRSELVRMKATGLAKEFSDWVQENILDYGHEVEALARPLAERIIGDDLYPATLSLGKESASCDGLNMAETIRFEHKQWNAALAASVMLTFRSMLNALRSTSYPTWRKSDKLHSKLHP